MSIFSKANELVNSKNVKQVSNNFYEIIGYKGKYGVYYSKDKQTCTCKAFSLNQNICSHIEAVKIFRGEDIVKN
jgi:hypothetical protein